MRFTIVGGGVAGITAAKALRERAEGAEITVFSQDKYPYYSKIRLPQLLDGRVELSGMFMYPENWYEDRAINVRLASEITAVDPQAKTVEVDGSTQEYDKLLLAHGARAFVPPIEGLPKEGAFTLWTIDDALKIREAAARAKRGIVIGGGVLGLEVASSLSRLGLEVTVVEMFPRLLPRQLDQEGAELLQRSIEATGVKFVLGAATEMITGSDAVGGARMKDGSELNGDLIVISAGARSNISIAAVANLETGKGIIVDDYLQTSHPDILAAGDVIEHAGRLYGIIPPAIEQAQVAASNMVEPKSARYEGSTPSNTLKVSGVSVTSIGLAQPDGAGYEIHRARDEEAGTYRKLVVQDNRLVGAIIVGTRKNVSLVRRMIREKHSLDGKAQGLLEENARPEDFL